MDAVASAAPDTEAHTVYRCARCGIESPERSCFVVPDRHGKPPHDTRCIICEQQRLATGTLDGILGVARSVFLPLVIVVAIQRGLGDLTMWTVLAGCLMAPVAIVAHEIGHAAVGRLIGLEVSTVVIGTGPRIWRETIFGICFTVNAWPLTGLTFFGARSLALLRTRLWFGILAGPATNIAIALVTSHYWDRLVDSVGAPALTLWIVTNALLAAQSLLPYRFKHGTDTMMSDGFQLLQVPGRTSEQLEPHLFTSALLRGYTQFEAGDFAGAQAVCIQGLQRVPENVHLSVLLSSCRSYAHDYAGSLAILRPLLHLQANTDAGIFAAIENNIAFALVMSNPQADPNSEAVIEADRLSAHAFSLYPCVLAYRSTRALVLTARGQPEKALALLEYEHYETGPRAQQAHRETTRAFALHALNQREESRRASAEAARLSPETVGFLDVLGLG